MPTGRTVYEPTRFVTWEHALQTFSPREVQARVRAGETAESIADDTGWPLGKVTRYAEPLLAERAYIAEQAQAVEVRRSGGGASLREAAHATAPGQDIAWDAHRRDDGRWVVTATVAGDVAAWTYDHSGRNVHPLDDLARALMGAGPLPGGGDDAEDADIIDALNLVAGVPVVREEPAPDAGRPRLVAVPNGGTTDDAATDDDTTDHDTTDHDTTDHDTADEFRISPSHPTVAVPRPAVTNPAAQTAEAPAPAAKKATARKRSARKQSAPKAEPTEAPRKPKPRKGRASVPSWDEILFGSANAKDDDPA